jgi:membrane-bound ClpP family serine protease
MVLAPPSDLELAEIARKESLASFEHLLGSRGSALTPLIPAGKARFGDDLLNVITNGEFIDRGCDVVVIEVRGSRVVVRAAS